MNQEYGSHPRGYHITVVDGIDAIESGRERFAVLLERGSLSVELYVPRGEDHQQPHTRDELYVVIAGNGEFVNGDVRHGFGPGDVLFVAAGVVHRFENFTQDLTVWVMFYGPEGGEAP